jgi:hypothetical protein
VGVAATVYWISGCAVSNCWHRRCLVEALFRSRRPKLCQLEKGLASFEIVRVSLLLHTHPTLISPSPEVSQIPDYMSECNIRALLPAPL